MQWVPGPAGGRGRGSRPRAGHKWPYYRPNPARRAGHQDDLRAGGPGRLRATGTIQPGTARLFAQEIDKRGSYVTTQRISAICQNYLRDMGVDLAVWTHAMETPAASLYTFKKDELLTLKLVTDTGGKSVVEQVRTKG